MVKDTCFVLNRFPTGELSLIARCYCKKLGKVNFLLPDYFEYKKYPLGSFEPFNLTELYAEAKNGTLVVEDVLNYKSCFKGKVSYKRFIYLSEISKTVLQFLKEADEGIFNLLLQAREIEDFYEFNLIRFWFNLSLLLGFSIENLKKPGWVNVLNLTKCRNEELGSYYCVYISPRIFNILKKISDERTKPFLVREKNFKELKMFFHRFLKLQTENF
jgi:hypothetical protein